MAELPTGTVTFLFTDLEASTRLWEEEPEAMQSALARHDEILRAAVEARGGSVVKTTGDGVHAAFQNASEAVVAAIDAQLALAREDWGDAGSLSVRMGIHTGEAEHRDGDYYGPALNHAARLMAAGHGGQVLVSGSAEPLTRNLLPEGAALTDAGMHSLPDVTDRVHVFQLAHPELRMEFPPLRTLDTLPGNLPRQFTTFVGREPEIASLASLARESPLVTLTGVGGVGKTRLALQVAADVATDFPNGAWLCEFAPVSDPGAVWETLAASLRVQSPPGRSLEESVLEYLAPKRALLVLDNCEHLLDAIARQADTITRRCSLVTVLATSREGLALAGERIVAVPSLGLPAEDADSGDLMHADAVRLFVDRAGAAKSDFALTDRNADAVVVLCRRLDGIPLAIELAASRVRSMSPEDLVARLDQRFKLLTQGSRAALERHQTLRNTIDWSYDLLDSTERQALNRLSVFAGGCDLAAAEAVLSGVELDAVDVADLLGQLVDKSLAIVDESDDGGSRYRLLESIRQYAREQLQASGGTAAVRARHADHFVARAEAAGAHLRSRDQTAWAAAVARDTDNFRVALDWAVETESPGHALRLVAPLTVLGLSIGDAAMEWAATACTIPGADRHPLFPVAAAWASWGSARGREFARADQLVTAAEHAERALDARSPLVARARASLEFYRGDLEAARQRAQEAVGIAQACGDQYELATAVNMLGVVLLFDGPLDAALTTFEESVRVAREAGTASAVVNGLNMIAFMLPIEESERALALLDEAIELGARINDRLGISLATMTKGGIAARRGEWRAALEASVDSAQQQLQLGEIMAVSGSLGLGALAFSELGHLETAAVLLGKADAIGQRQWLDWAIEMGEAADAALLEALGEQQVATLAARGAGLDTADAVAYQRAEADRALGAE